jgi:hypothetical protein
VHLYYQKKLKLSSSQKIILVKNVFYALVEKYFFTLLWQFFSSIKKLRNVPFYIRKKITAPKSKIEKIKIEDFFGRKLFLPHCGSFFSLIKLKCHCIGTFIYRKKIQPQNRNLFIPMLPAVSKVDLEFLFFKVFKKVFKVFFRTLWGLHLLRPLRFINHFSMMLCQVCSQSC